MTTLEELLARTRLVDAPAVPRDVVPLPDAFAEQGEDYERPPKPTPRSLRQRVSDAAARDLRTLCEALVFHTAADALQEEFIAERVPAPRGARALGCILQLTQDVGSARMWWQFAAGAGDDTASYCLYLHHLALGETDAAAWWRKQTKIHTRRSPITENLPVTHDDIDDIEDVDRSIPTLLRVLSQLLSTTKRCSSEVVDALMAFVPYAVATGHREDPDMELPAPYAGFAEHITIVLAAAASFHPANLPQQHDDERRALSRRDRGASLPHDLRRARPATAGQGAAKPLEAAQASRHPGEDRVA